jgi:hypothetical protein
VLASLYQTLAPVTEALLRVAVGLALVPHGLGMTFGFFPTTCVYRKLDSAILVVKSTKNSV